GRADDEVGEPVAIDVAGGSDREAAFAHSFAVEANPLAGRQIGKIDIASGTAAEDKVCRADTGHSAHVAVGRADDQIDDAVAVHVAGRGDGKAGRSRLLADDAEAVARVEAREVDVLSRRVAVDQGAAARPQAPVATRMGRADQDIAVPIAVDVAESRNGVAAVIAGRRAVDPYPIAARRGSQRHVREPAGLAEDDEGGP